ncbi:ABC transporter permease subunit [Phormidium sp. FACHB-592]|uniref:ABC transporter permease subunit n=1 Tax=Stenomitos frigidus AS-A4 TaxID=2933935 RepID=A0ABV0KSA0_9CYAN|nr:ABC transporter permease subunit [Phormidium sp. FACHB-592]MBD2074240.1 ABC transporter permease subunit [Phormidium sp. FACHB-592]
MTTVRRLLRSLLLSLSCLLLIVSMGRTESTELRVAVEPVYPPFEFRAANGEIQGFDIDVMRAVGKAAGFTVQFQSIAFDGMIPALQAQTVDAAISAMTITPARSNVVTFSRPYFKAGLAIAVREGTENVNRLEDLSGKSIAVQIGTTGADAAKQIPGATIRTFNAAVLTLQELSNGNVDAIINDAPVMLYAIKTGNLKGIRIVNQLLTEDFYGIPTPRNSPNLQRINQGLGTILSNGTYTQLYQKWFDAQPPELPATAPASATGNTTAIPSSTQVILTSLPPLLAGTLITLQLAAIAVILGLVGGSLIGIVRLSKVRLLRWAAAAYIDFFRGTPLLVQLFMIYFGIPAAFQALGLTFNFDRFLAAIIALSLNCAAYVAEIVRAGIQSIETGQSEAAASLGLDAMQTLRFVVFPQALRRMLPPLGNQFISLLKDTSLVAVIGFEELFRRGQLIVAENYRPFELYFAIALIYLALTLLSSQGFSYLERWMDPAQRGRKQFTK